MKVEELNSKVIQNVVALLKLYKEIKGDTPSEFLKENTSLYKSKENEANGQEEAIMELFLQVARHEKFLERFILQYYRKNKRIIHSDKYLLMVLCHVIIFFTNREQLKKVADILIKTSSHKSSGLASFLSHETGVLILIQAASCYFEQDYVKEKIAVEVLKDENIFNDLHSILKQSKIEPAKERILYLSHHVTDRKTTPPHPLENTEAVHKTTCHSIAEEEICPEKVRSIPQSTYKKPNTEKKLKQVHEKNKIQSLKNFQKAQTMPSHLTQPLRQQVLEPITVKVPTIKAKPPPDFKEPEVPVKMNTSSVLRQAIKIVKEEEEEIKRVKNLTVGALDYTQFEKLFMELRLKDEEEHLKSIEKKHLKGLSTYEEAILAKRDYLEKNKENRALYEKQKKELEEHLKEYKKIEEEKIRQLVQKTQDIQKNIDDKKRDLLNKKQKIAKEVMENSRLLTLELFKKRTAELRKKIELIKEIRTITAFRARKKEFDSTETMNIGLLCEMSIAELNERLTIVRAEMKEELEMRQQRIKQEKIRQHELLQEMKKLIEYNHVERKRINSAQPKTIKMVEPDEEILELRRKLEAAREKRKTNLN